MKPKKIELKEFDMGNSYPVVIKPSQKHRWLIKHKLMLTKMHKYLDNMHSILAA